MEFPFSEQPIHHPRYRFEHDPNTLLGKAELCGRRLMNEAMEGTDVGGRHGEALEGLLGAG